MVSGLKLKIFGHLICSGHRVNSSGDNYWLSAYRNSYSQSEGSVFLRNFSIHFYNHTLWQFRMQLTRAWKNVRLHVHTAVNMIRPPPGMQFV